MIANRVIMTGLLELGESNNFDSRPRSKSFLSGGVSGDEYGLSDILSRVYWDWRNAVDSWARSHSAIAAILKLAAVITTRSDDAIFSKRLKRQCGN